MWSPGSSSQSLIHSLWKPRFTGMTLEMRSHVNFLKMITSVWAQNSAIVYLTSITCGSKFNGSLTWRMAGWNQEFWTRLQEYLPLNCFKKSSRKSGKMKRKKWGSSSTKCSSRNSITRANKSRQHHWKTISRRTQCSHPKLGPTLKQALLISQNTLLQSNRWKDAWMDLSNFKL